MRAPLRMTSASPFQPDDFQSKPKKEVETPSLVHEAGLLSSLERPAAESSKAREAVAFCTSIEDAWMTMLKR